MNTYLTVYNHSVKLETSDGRLVAFLERFLKLYYTVIQKGFGPTAETTEVLYASKIDNYNVWYLHINQFRHFLSYCKDQNFELQNVERINETDYSVKKLPISTRPKWKLREDQQPVFDFVTDGTSNVKLLPLSTGSGKTVCAMMSLGTRKERMGIVILPQFIDKWVSDITEIHEATNDDVLLIQGGRSITGLVQMTRDNELTHKYIVFSARTLQNYVTEFETNPEETVEKYGCSPIELFTLTGIGSLLIDETHMSFHAIYKIVCHTNVRFQLGLSATLMSEDPVISRVHRVMYPSSTVYGDTMQKQYMDTYPVEYTIGHTSMRDIRTTQRGATFYSHTAFETSIMRRPNIFDSYYKIIRDCVQDYYLEDYMKGDKLVIFVSMIKMANKIIDRLRHDLKGKKIVRYCQEDSYDEMITGDVIVSTIGSLGTGIDIPNLRSVIQTVAISSPVSNIQSAGRLRYLLDRDVKFCYIYAANIPKHREYHMKRLDVLKDRIKSVTLRKSFQNL